MNVTVLGASSTKFGELWQISPRDLVGRTVADTLLEADIPRRKIQAVIVGNMLSGILGGQEHLGAFFAEELNLKVPAVKVESACASGGMAVHTAVMAIISGLYETVLVVGVEKMTDYKPEELAQALMGAGSDVEREAGATFPALYAMMARVHMDKYQTTETDMAAVAVKNHLHASLNSQAHFPFRITVEQVLASPKVASPLKLLDCSPVTDGAASILLTKSAKIKNKRQVSIIASASSTDSLGLSERQSLDSIKATSIAAKKAFELSAVSPTEVDIAEVHDCFTIAEIMAMEDIGFYKKGEAAPAIREGKTGLNGRPVVNISGGLKASGHPVGATGVKQIVEIYHQLKGDSGKRQVSKARVGLSHNVGGSGASAVIHILKSFK
ncbi:hypothetical protein A2Y99_00185 [Candidatus Gottesmanbacteria bacterium RBG_13_37_7]|uniref:Acetyl-CoA acetyltransferase n=1 Tax=Candidatus Gottesmanbacteria bacterium RBG_13_37_7 TaxID=1798369 RepID=A0A1F5YH37_9BACT|nr:MAG: hypothetical protein A2Y99_00185 [Candidatus Gottesmanbacteria bacterium RBG_13_37_7]